MAEIAKGNRPVSLLHAKLHEYLLTPIKNSQHFM